MGDRINFGFTTDTGDILYLYSHWGAGSWLKDLQDALSKASGRFNDNSYAVRITASQLIGDQWNQDLGYGFSINSIGDSDVDFVPVVDFKYGFVRIYELDYNDLSIREALVKIEINKFIELDNSQIHTMLDGVLLERYGKND